MKLLYCLLLLLPTLSLADEAQDPRSFTTQDMADLSARIAKDLRKCKQLHHGAELTPAFTNATEEFIDKDAFTKQILAGIPSSPGGPGKKYDLGLKLTSQIEQKGAAWKGTYTLYAELRQANEVLCRKDEKLVKKAQVPKGTK